MKKNQLTKIGIRPVIDGRRKEYVSRSKEQTMNMAKSYRSAYH